MCAAQIKIKKQDYIATLTLSNPDKRNALDKDAWGKLSYAMASLDMDRKIRCVVIRGEGTDAFAAGADISEFPTVRTNAAQAKEYGDVVAMALDTLQGCRHPTVAMIHGACTGGGLEIACSCDIRIAGQTARFGVPINRIGHALAPPEMKPALDLLGPATVLEMLFEGRLYDAQEALQKGLVNRVVADDGLAESVYATADRIAAGAPLAAQMTKKMLKRLMTPKPMSEQELIDSYAPCDSQDYAEGVRAFLAKETPKFEGQ